jgi:hypothetical protein
MFNGSQDGLTRCVVVDLVEMEEQGAGRRLEAVGQRRIGDDRLKPRYAVLDHDAR